MTATIPPPPPPPSSPTTTTTSPTTTARQPKSAMSSLRQSAAAARRGLRESGEAMSPTSRALVWTFGVLAALALWLVLFGLVLSGLVESHAQSGLFARFRLELAGGVAPLGGAIAEGAPVALLSSSAGGLHNVVAVEGSSSTDLRDGPGHLPGTPLPGQAGFSLILGRSTSFGAPFAHVADLRPGDVITATTGQGRFTYVVQDLRRPGDPIPASLLAASKSLTLVTSDGGGWRSGWAPSYAIYVDAVLKGQPQPAPAQGSIPSVRDAAMAHDTRGLYPLVLWLQLLLVAAVGGVWVRSRWGGSRALLIALPIGVAALWGASQSAWLLLPNLL